jgi:hypothetical protein
MPARRTTNALAGAAIAIVALGGLTACSSNSGTGASSASEVNLSGSPVAAKDEMTALCKQIVAEALTVDAATALADANGYVSRVTKVDGQGQAVTTDLREDRFNFEVKSDVVVACTLG